MIQTPLSINEIVKKLPHRYPFLLIDRVIAWTSHESITTIKNVTFNEPFFLGHFPSKPVMPGVLIVEALAQSAGVLAYLSDDKTYQDHLFYLAAIENARFKKIVEPGDTLRLEIKSKSAKRHFWKVIGEAFVDDQLVCSSELTSARSDV